MSVLLPFMSVLLHKRALSVEKYGEDTTNEDFCMVERSFGNCDTGDYRS